MMASTRIPLAVVVLTYNEERNLPACLSSVSDWVSELYVVDAGSTDQTVAIAAHHGACVVTHLFENHARQWHWALHHLPITAEWVLGLDADQRITPALQHEMTQLMCDKDTAEAGPAGYYLKRKQIFRGRWIKHGGYYPKYLLKLFRRSAVWVDENDLVDHHFRVQGEVGLLQHDLIEDNQNEADISVWVAKHNRYATLQAREEMTQSDLASRSRLRDALFGSPDQRTQWRRQLWRRLPLYLRPALYFFYRYVCRLGFLDGKEGFVFHALQAFWYRLLVDIKVDELHQQQADRSTS
ncbi:MAG: glycosyltransferase family 2 protein [Candidatus Tectomicrobia bacterium]|nr:glycosyltransferase family 2 protein [Candidatus Tectomicrobia bacterium]